MAPSGLMEAWSSVTNTDLGGALKVRAKVTVLSGCLGLGGRSFLLAQRAPASRFSL